MEIKTYLHTWITPNGETKSSTYDHPTKAGALEGRARLVKRSKDNESYLEYFQEDWPYQIREMTFPVQAKVEGVQVISLVEECGYQHWVWFFQGSEQDLAAFWEDITPYWHDAQSLPGEVFLADIFPNGLWAFRDKEQGRDGERFFVPSHLWDGRGHIHMDEDSSLSCNGRVLMHKGRRRAEIEKAWEAYSGAL